MCYFLKIKSPSCEVRTETHTCSEFNYRCDWKKTKKLVYISLNNNEGDVWSNISKGEVNMPTKLIGTIHSIKFASKNSSSHDSITRELQTSLVLKLLEYIYLTQD